jgi:hypothetical protein
MHDGAHAWRSSGEAPSCPLLLSGKGGRRGTIPAQFAGTLLAYLRSAVCLVIAGVTILHLSSVGWFWAVGLAYIPAGVIVGLVAVARYVAMGRKIGAIKSRSKARGTTDVE